MNEMRRELEIKDYKTVWVMAHKIRKAMADRDARYSLSGLVELDEITTCQATLIVNRVTHRLRLAEIRQLLFDIQALKPFDGRAP